MIVERACTLTCFKNLELGDAFMYKSIEYMKITSLISKDNVSISAVTLKGGLACSFKDDDFVELLNAKVIITPEQY